LPHVIARERKKKSMRDFQRHRLDVTVVVVLKSNNVFFYSEYV